MKRHQPSLDYYSFDFVENPWLGGGGAYRDLEILSRWTEQFGVIRLFVGGYPGAVPHKRQGIEVIPLGNGKSEWVSRLIFVLKSNWKIWWQPADVIGLSLSLYSPFFAVGRHPQRTFGVLHHIIGSQWICKMGKPGKVACSLEMAYYRLIRFFVLSNQAVADAITECVPKSQIFLSSNAFNPELLVVKDATQTQFPFILFIGRLDRFMKGLDRLMECFTSIANKFPALRLVLAGHAEPEAETELVQLAERLGIGEKLTLHKDISEAEKQDLLSKCLFFCSPSRFEGFGIAALEASAAGKAVLVSDASGYHASVCDGVSGIRVCIETAMQLETAMEKLVVEDKLRLKLGVQGREWARRFTWDAIAKREGEWLYQCMFMR